MNDFSQLVYDVVATVSPIDDRNHRHEFLVGSKLPLGIALQLATSYWQNMLHLRPVVEIKECESGSVYVKFFTYISSNDNKETCN